MRPPNPINPTMIEQVIGYMRRANATLGITLAKQLANHFFDRQFLHVDIDDGALGQDLPAGLGHFGARHF